MYDICCIGHITLDRVITPGADVFMPGGTAWYFSKSISRLPIKYTLITALADTEKRFAQQLMDEGINVQLFPSEATVYFENIYPGNLDERSQRVLQTASHFTPAQVADTKAKIFHLGTLLSDDIPLNVITALKDKGKVAADIQGYLRKLDGNRVSPTDWKDKIQALPCIDFLKVNEQELTSLTGTTDIKTGARQLFFGGAKEIVITLGSRGSVIYNGGDFYNIPAYPPAITKDATGCGDTYMAGYLYQRVKGASPEDAGKFAAAMATLKIEQQGAFEGTEDDLFAVIKKNNT